MKRENLYPGTDTPVTAPLLTLECENGHRYWHLTPQEYCTECGAKVIKGNPPKKNLPI